MMRLFVFVCLASVLDFGCAQKKAIEDKGKPDGCLDYSFGKEYPHAFKFYNDKVVIGDGEKLIVFNKSGKEVNRIVLPENFLDGRIFLDFVALTDTSYLVTIYGKLYRVSPRNQKLLVEDFGELIRGEPPIIATTFQKYDSVSNVNVNGVKVLRLEKNKLFKYPSKRDLGTYNFEVLDKGIALYTSDNSFCILPVDTTQEGYCRNASFESPSHPTFLGVSQKDFVFLSHNFEEKKDHLYFYDADMKFVKEAILDVSFSDISDIVIKDGNFHMEAPFGNFYIFDKSSSTVYVFRHTKKNGICYFPIENHLRVIKEAK